MNKTDTVFPLKSQHGTPIALDQVYPKLTKEPLVINNQVCGPSNGDNPDRYKQHGFHFNASNCIACHACESACSEKNDLDPHMAYRRVGTIEGGCYPDVTRINISMACNHCEDPVCLKGCPTRAYTKYLEYGAVLQDPEICFGCGYCTWVCPYNAPQLDTEKGQVQKCNMCIDRLEVGLQPACVDACLGNALDFGVIENIPQKQQEAKLSIPSFTDPSISKPNIRFQLNTALPETFHRLDDVPLDYEKSPVELQPTQAYRIKEKQSPVSEEWGWRKLRSREDSLVLFTLISQFVVGAFLMLFLVPRVSAPVAELISFKNYPVVMGMTVSILVVLQTFGLVLSTLHLGKPQYFYRAMNNLRHSWVSREIATMGGFYAFLTFYSVVSIFPALISWFPESVERLLPSLAGSAATILGPAAIYAMYRCYRIPARPFWDHWHSGGAFVASGLILGSSALGLIFGVTGLWSGNEIAPLLRIFVFFLITGLVLQRVALFYHLRDLKQRGEEAAVALMLMTETHGKIYRARLLSWKILLGVGLACAVFPPETVEGMMLWGGMFVLSMIHEMVGRALFYVAVVPTTVPRGFFWGNHSFENLARASGLAMRPQTGVVKEDH